MKLKKENTLLEFKYLLFYSIIDLFGVKDFKRNLIRKGVYREFDVAVFIVRGISLWKSFNFNLCTHISNRLLNKTVPAFFLIISYSFFIAISR